MAAEPLLTVQVLESQSRDTWPDTRVKSRTYQPIGGYVSNVVASEPAIGCQEPVPQGEHEIETNGCRDEQLDVGELDRHAGDGT